MGEAPAHEEGADCPVQDHREPDQQHPVAAPDPEADHQRDPHDPPISDPISLDIVLTKWMMVTKEVGHGRKATEARTCEQ